MKKLAIALLLTFFCQNSQAQIAKFTLEKNHSSITWSVNHFGFSKVSAKFTDIDGEINFDEKNPQNSSVVAIVNMNALTSGLVKFDSHLKSKEIFNIDENKTAKFVSQRIKIIGKNKARIDGELTLMNVTKPISLFATFNKIGTNPINQKPTIGFSAIAKINRSEFNLGYALPAIADEVDLAIEIEANQ